ncbi:MAG: exodeoxyribonuclease VII large subunit [Terriglobia bacterium]
MSQAIFNFEIPRRVYTVSALTQEIRRLLEPKFLDVWVTGEVSNCRAASSGHFYFTLKDVTAQIRVACFRKQVRYLKFKPQDGVALIVRGRLSVYDGRGEYQILAEYLEPAGLGALQLAFEQLKQKLAAEGFFDPARRKPIPLLPAAIGIVTSPTGAAVRDVLRVLRRRFRNVNVIIFPARVQGDGAADEVAAGIRHFNCHPSVDVIILARGGGSIEDLWPFNEERLARVIAASAIPIISAVGHETDFTIADFVADLRAPTPSAAAELVVRRRQEFETELRHHERRLAQGMGLIISERRRRLTELAMGHVFQTFGARLVAKSQKLDEITLALDRQVRDRVGRARQRWVGSSSAIARIDFRRLLGMRRAKLDHACLRLEADLARFLTARRHHLARLNALLRERSPIGILERGYSITRDAEGRIVRDAAGVPLEGSISVRLARGELSAIVRGKNG